MDFEEAETATRHIFLDDSENRGPGMVEDLDGEDRTIDDAIHDTDVAAERERHQRQLRHYMLIETNNLEVMLHRELDHSPSGFVSSLRIHALYREIAPHLPAPGNYLVGEMIAARLRSGVYDYVLQEPDGPALRFRSVEGLHGFRCQRIYERTTDATGAMAASRIRSLYHHYRDI